MGMPYRLAYFHQGDFAYDAELRLHEPEEHAEREKIDRILSGEAEFAYFRSSERHLRQLLRAAGAKQFGRLTAKAA